MAYRGNTGAAGDVGELLASVVPQQTIRTYPESCGATARLVEVSKQELEIEADNDARLVYFPLTPSKGIISFVGSGVTVKLIVPRSAALRLYRGMHAFFVDAKKIEWAQRRDAIEPPKLRESQPRKPRPDEIKELARKARLNMSLAADRQRRDEAGEGRPPTSGQGGARRPVTTVEELNARGVVPGATVAVAHREAWGHRGRVLRYAYATGYKPDQGRVWGVRVRWDFPRGPRIYVEPADSVWAVAPPAVD